MLSNANSGVAVEQSSPLESRETRQRGRGTRLCLSAQRLVATLDQGPIPVTLELDSPSITEGSCCVGLGASSGAPKAGAASSTTLMKQTRLDDGIYNCGTKSDAGKLHGSNAAVSERCSWLELKLIGYSCSLRLSYRSPNPGRLTTCLEL